MSILFGGENVFSLENYQKLRDGSVAVWLLINLINLSICSAETLPLYTHRGALGI